MVEKYFALKYYTEIIVWVVTGIIILGLIIFYILLCIEDKKRKHKK